ncbi:MAG: phosphoribosylformylglycinamidine synthase subunit PurQ, partial [Alkalispirochaeta sp.]
FSRRVKRANDFGAGGVSVAVGEIAEGVSIDLDAVPVKYEGLTGTELAISESQERMAIVIDPTDFEFVRRATAAENLEATVIARVTRERRLVMYHAGKRIVDIARSFLDTNGARRSARVRVTPPGGQGPTDDIDILDPTRWLTRIADPDAASRKGLSENFDSTIGAGTLLAPWGGRYQLTPVPVGAARIPHPADQVSTASLISYGFFPETATASPYHGAYWSVVEAVARLVCAGARRSRIRLSLQEYFPRTGSDPERWGLPYAALLGALEAQLALGTAAIGGKDSMSGSFEDLDVPPTLVAFSFAAGDEDRIVGPEFSPDGGPLVLLAPPVGPGGLIDPTDVTATFDLVEELIGSGTVRAAGSVSESGVAVSLTTAAMGNWCSLDLDESALHRADELVGVMRGRQVAIYLQLAAPPTDAVRNTPGFIELGTVRNTTKDPVYPADRHGPIGPTQSGSIVVGKRTVSLEAARDAWFSYLEPLFPLDAYDSPGEQEHQRDREPADTQAKGASLASAHATPAMARSTPATAHTVAAGAAPARHPARGRVPSTVHPRVCIPVFPGTNCEYDSERAFRDVGAEVVTPVFRKHSSEELNDSIRDLATAIGSSQILMFPGGFSAGDEPDGSGKYIAAVFRDERLVEAIASLINDRDGLILGICNGFQALVRMGLLPDGVSGLTAPPRTALFFNAGLHHISTIVPTRVTSTLSPWLAGTEPEQIYRVPISHGEGRFVASPEVIAELTAGGQIATQYVQYNPNGSRNAIEGISSPDGRILGKMAHTERVRPGLYRNVPPLEDMKLFENGVAYFR